MKKLTTSQDQTLRQYLINQNVKIDCLLLKESDFFSDTRQFVNFLETTLVTRQLDIQIDIEAWKFTKFMSAINRGLSYSQVINTLIKFLLHEKIANVLTFGYYYHSDKFAIDSEILNPNMSFCVNQLKNPFWEKVYKSIPLQVFLKLVLTRNCFILLETGNYAQIFGLSGNLNKEYYEKNKMFMKRKALYMKEGYYKYVLPCSPDELIIKILLPNSLSKKKKYSQLQIICREIIRNHSRCPYRELFKSIVLTTNEKVTDESFFALSSPLPSVIRFVSVIFGRIFPLQLWGTTKNKSLMFQKVVEYLKLAKNDYLEIHTVLKGIKTKDILWLHNSSNYNSKSTSLQESKKMTSQLINLLCWFFDEYLPKLIGGFWYVTESSKGSASELLYFPHKVWNDISMPWLEKYKKEYLRISSSCVEHTSNQKQPLCGNEYFHGILRLIPKQQDFRLLCIPMKSNIRLYNNYIYNYIHPIRALLRRKVLEKASEYKHACCYSTSDIIINLQEFIERLNLKNESRKLYIVKFDMKQCYDMLNKRQVINIVDELFHFQGSTEERTYFAREFGKTSSTRSKFKSTLYKIEEKRNIHKLDIFQSREKSMEAEECEPVLIDKCITKVFTESEIFNIIYDQVFHSRLIMNSGSEKSCFERQKGLFQGFPLLGTLCDIAYIDLVHTYFNFLELEHSILLRLADDFMVISTERGQCEEVYSLIQEGFNASHGAIVNTEKTVTVNLDLHNLDRNLVQFVGLTFNPTTLDIHRNTVPEIPISNAHLRSPKSLFSYLTLYYKRKLNEFKFNFEIESVCCILDNIEGVLRSVLDSFCTNWKLVSKTEGRDMDSQIVLFFLNLMATTLECEDEYDLSLELVNMFNLCLELKSKSFPFLNVATDMTKHFIHE